MVEFQDSFGHPLVGYLRCARVNHRPIAEDLPMDEPEPEPTTITPTMLAGAKRAKLRQEAEEQELSRIAAAAAAMPFYGAAVGVNNSSNSSSSGGSGQSHMDLSNFRMLTECMTTMADSQGRVPRSVSQDTTGTGMGTGTTTGTAGASPRGPVDPEADSEFVCVIRTSDSYFARYSTRSDLYMFVSTPLSAESIEAHDERSGRNSNKQLSASSRNSADSSTIDVSTSTAPWNRASSDMLQHPQAASAIVSSLCPPGVPPSPHDSNRSGVSNISGQKRNADSHASEGSAGSTDLASESQH